ncbi:MAG: hypothetical protein ACTSRZ_18260 [Promethearchaeota archaeon]
MGVDSICKLIYGYNISSKYYKGGGFYEDEEEFEYDEDESEHELEDETTDEWLNDKTQNLKFKVFDYSPGRRVFIGFELAEISQWEIKKLEDIEYDPSILRERFKEFKTTIKYLVKDEKILDQEPKLWLICYLDTW